MYADFTKSRTVCFISVYADHSARHLAIRINVADKRAARAYCKANGIKPWNF